MPFTVRVSDARGARAGRAIRRRWRVENALRKARAARRAGAAEAVLGCDTIVALDGAIYGKPADEAAARATLSALGGRTHEVISGLALLLATGARGAAAHGGRAHRGHVRGARRASCWTGTWRPASGASARAATRSRAPGAQLAVRDATAKYENVVGLPLRPLLELYPELLGS